MNKYLSDLSESLARGAFAGVSMSPERRGDSFRTGYAEELEADYLIFQAHATKGGTLDQLEAEFARYRAGYRKVCAAFLASESRCISSFITGPSNFPVRRAEKRNRIAHARLGEMIDFRTRAKAAAIRNLRPDLRPIMAGDANAVERIQQALDQHEAYHCRMLATNKAIRANAKHGREAQIGALMFLGFTEGAAGKLLEPDFCGRIGFADYQLTNNGAQVRRLKKRLAQVSAAKAAPLAEVESANGIRLEDDPPANRVRLFFPGKPAPEVRAKLKKNGFRWAPTVGAWQAYRNSWSLSTAAEYVKEAA